MDDEQASELDALEVIFSDPSAEPIKLSYGLLKLITDNFSKEIGRGGFGVVYRGDLRNGTVAVKRSNGFNVTDKQFMDEIKCLKTAQHKNIVRFLGYCADTQEEVMPLGQTFVMAGDRNRLFCFEYVPNGNVRQYLEQEKTNGDDWPTRYQMIRGICQGLQYLHDKKINHLDLKPENVMLDAHMEARITDFGLSRFLDQGQSRIITQHICGTMRYIAPEIIEKNELSFKSDMYALGIIIIELLTGTSMISLENWDAVDVLDCPRAMMCVEIARNCTDVKRDNRPTIHEVINCMDALESMIPKFFTTNQLVTATVFPATELLNVYPLEIKFLFLPEEDLMSCHLTMTNKTDGLVYCLLLPKYNYWNSDHIFHYYLTPMSSSVATVCLKAEEELPSDMIEWEILMFTTRYEELDLKEMLYPLPVDKGTPYDVVIKAVQDLLGGELHQATLMAWVIVESEPPVIEVHRLGQEEGTSIKIKLMDVHPTEPWVLLSAGDMVYIWNWLSDEKVGEHRYRGFDDLGKITYNIVALSALFLWRKRVGDDLGFSLPLMIDFLFPVAKFIARELWVVIGNTDGSIFVLTCPTMDPQKKKKTCPIMDIVKGFHAHDNEVTSLEVHPTRPLLLSFSSPFSLRLWDWSSGWSCTTTFVVRDVPLRNVRFRSKDTNTFATRRLDGSLQMWVIGQSEPVATACIPDHLLGRKSYLFTYTGHWDFTAAIHNDNEGTISIWDLRREKHVYTLRTGESDKAVVAACHPTLPIFATVSKQGHIQVWDSTTHTLKMAYHKLPQGPKHLGFTGSGRLVIGYKDKIAIMDIDVE